jgi:imidazolonepropionase-like amidohydrolase
MRKSALLPLLCLCAAFVWAQAQSYFPAPDDAATISAEAKSDKVTAFVNVNIIPMDRERVLKEQTLIVREGKIAELGEAAKIKVPKDALRIDGRGRYLIPGLMDMHTHLFSDGEFPKSLAGDELAIMLANGVTTIRLMIGTPEHLIYRKKIAEGEMLGPALYVASPEFTGRKGNGVFNGRLVTTPDDARAAVRECKGLGYDFIKLTTSITRPVYDAVIETAKEQGIRVVGHVDAQVGLQHALTVGQEHIEHLDSYLEALLRDDAPMKDSVSDFGVWRKSNWESLDYVDESKIAALTQATAKTGNFSCPTLTFFKINFAVEQSDDEIRARPDFRFYPPNLHARLFAAHTRFWTNPPSAERRAKYQRVRNQLVKAIHEAGGKIMAGSDSPELFLVYGFTLHRELQNLVAAGLSNYDALAAATCTPAEFLKAFDTIGSIELGKRADLILLTANPLDDIANTEKRAGVMVRGRWLPQAELQKQLDEIALRFQNLSSAR